jgi:uracil-DNA glycosylase
MSILILSDYPSLNEAGRPFTNGYWSYFRAQLRRAGINPDECIWMNVFNSPASSFYAFTQESKSGALTGVPYVARKAYLRAEFGPELHQLYTSIRRIKPNIIVTCGELALLVVTHQQHLKFARGRVTTSITSCGTTKVLPVLHPRAVMAEIKQEPILLMDLQKAKRQSTFSEVIRPQRYLHLRPSLEDLESFWQEFILSSSSLSIDIETKNPIITCVGISPSPDRSLVIPFFTKENPTGNYWATAREEKIAWQFVYRCLNTPGKRVFGQNFQYDTQYLWRYMGIPCSSWTDDTMLMHHALQIEMNKGLGFLASIYSEELAWKFMHKRRAADRSSKKEDE